MIPGSLARRYAKALLALAESPLLRDRFDKDLERFVETVRVRDPSGATILQVLCAKRFPLSERTALLRGVAGRLGLDGTLTEFLAYVLRRDRMVGIAQIARAYRRLADDAAGRVRAVYTTARPLAPADASAVTRALQAALGKQIVATTRVDPEILGGIVVQVGSYLIDGSVRAQLARLRNELRNAS